MERQALFMKRPHIAIVGGGPGGLAAAITLANDGMRVSLFEKNSHFGGKLMPVELDSYHFDFGPNTITMPHIFREVIEQTGRDPDQYFQFENSPSIRATILRTAATSTLPQTAHT